VLLALCACRSPFADEGPEVVVYTPFPEITAKELKKAFEKKTKIRVIMVTEGTTKVRGLLRAEKENPQADVWYGGGGIVPFIDLADEGLLEPYVPKGYEDMPETRGNLILRDPDFHWTGLAVIALGFAYNPQVLPPDKVPKTWEDLIDPYYKGKIEMWNPGVSGTAMLFLDSVLMRAISEGDGEEAGWDYLKAYWRNLKGYTVEGKPAFNVARGASPIGIHFEHQVLEFMEEQAGGSVAGGSKNIQWTLLPDSPVCVDAICLIKGGPNPENGKLFIDFVMSPEGQKIINRFFFSIDPDMPAPAGVGDWTLEKLSQYAQKLDPLWMAENDDKIRKRWQNEIEQIPKDR
jgi:iron(III) transport system substrate-binding protein